VNVYNILDSLPPIDEINYAGINYNPTYNEAGIIGRAFKVGIHVKY
jgi:iron complex outermembrane recepter protein